MPPSPCRRLPGRRRPQPGRRCAAPVRAALGRLQSAGRQLRRLAELHRSRRPIPSLSQPVEGLATNASPSPVRR
ncbi:hypothetical protein VM98_26260 [Streptomyces rubellomurinus subsp. indigoferus]|nr:hypothetical protein VM98_26260 [Streptomyces rubellomurinus subsp. indigoferus]